MHKVFISHSSPDKQFVEVLANNLVANGIDVWYDKWEIRIGESLVDKINSGISDCTFMIVVLSETSINSAWVTKELNSFLIVDIERRSTNILPLLLHPVKDLIPPLIKDRRYADFTGNCDQGFRELLQRLKNCSEKQTADIKFVFSKSYHDWESVLNNLPTGTKTNLKRFVNKLNYHITNIGDTAFITERIQKGSFFEAEIISTEDVSNWSSLSLYGLVNNALLSWDLASQPKTIYFAAKLTKLGYLVAKELGC